MRLFATRIWFAALPSWPAPEGPSAVRRRPIDSKTGLAFSIAATSPPTKNVRVPSTAPFCPPDTGASRKRRPFSASRAEIARAASAAIVEQSITIEPRRAPTAVPDAPRWTSSTSGASGTHETTTSAPSAAAAGVFAARASRPSAERARTNASAFPGDRVATASGKPAFAMFLAMPWPIVPSPMKATRSGEASLMVETSLNPATISP